jgi:predicted membrane chloride channel (bestrophin family)
MNLGGSSNRELIAWCLLDIETAKKAGLIDVRTAIEFRDQILKLRASMGTLYNYLDQPISFFYVHFICLLSALYLPLFAVSQAYNAGTGDDVFWTADLLAGLIVFLQSVFVIGLRLLGQKMSDPFGDDLEDLSVMHYINFTWMQSNRILQSSAPSELDAAEEEEIFRTSKSIGGAWQGDEIFESEILPEDEPEEFKDAPSIYCAVQ